ncbi:hypothetical protein GJV85_12850 [Sulfurimonas aquatica]|uniref:Conjugal transfer protein TraF n=1 Tax=Sulfurimonas aquatica TaxID=2672570 RepID=A0A975B2J0_9BACT|nr:hypothetical protein [Sulfurimonas aquatica]QSZ42958.1 hypothetical protein GJV85_12850 [Sulfurimonas aquatica]
MKKIISLALICATTSLMALDGEHAYLYKDPRIMGMGGANVAVGGYSTSVFSNPAGLASIKKEHGFVFDLLGLGVSVSEKTTEFIKDMGDVDTSSSNPNATNDMIDVLKKYSGEHFHMGVDNYSAISKNSDLFAWSVGLLAAADINYKVHANGGSSFLETSSRTYGGVLLGAAKSYSTDIGRLDVGVGLKFIKQISFEGGLTINDLLASDDIATRLEDKYKKESTGFGGDIGATLFPFAESSLHPAVGISILNIGSMGMDDNYGRQPMTLNIGMSISPEVPVLESFTLAVDYVDMLNANKVRFYDINGNVDADLDESDMKKRLRLGANLGVLDSTYLSLALSGGIYQGAYTAGIDLEFLLFKLNVATYQEEVGTGTASNPDRRYMAKLGIGW